MLLLACANGSVEVTDTTPSTGCTCDDGLECTDDACDADGRCLHTPVETCSWPSTLPPDVTALGELEDDFAISLSGATWNPSTRELWVVRGDGATAWSLVEAGESWEIAEEFSLGNIDAESVVLADPEGAPELLHVMVELEEVITAFDAGEELRTWETSRWLDPSGTSGSEGLAFVPDSALAEWGFETSELGYGGLFFVGTQNGGDIHAFDLGTDDDEVEHLGSWPTSRSDTSGLEFDTGTGRLYAWHGGDDNDLEILRLSDDGLVTEAIFDYPEDANIEGIALADACVDGVRPLFLTIDDGRARALDVYDWPVCR